MKQSSYSRYFRVFYNDTAITEISTNDFISVSLKQADAESRVYSLTTPLFYGYLTRSKAMEMAKAGALKHINLLLSQGKAGEEALYQYRYDHFEDLTVNLVEGNIMEVEDEAAADQLVKDSLAIQPS